MSFVSPGAYGREIDLSLFIETASNTSLAMAHLFNKGPIGERTLITNLAGLLETFGEPIDPSVDAAAAQGWFAAREYLRYGNKLYVTRIESEAQPAEYAAMSIQGSDDSEMGSGSDGATSIPATREFTSAGSTFVTDGVTTGDILELSGGADDGFYVIESVDSETQVTINRDFPTGSLSSQTFTIHASKREGEDNGVTSSSSARRFTSTGRAFTDQVRVGDILVINDTGDTGDNSVYHITRVVSDTELEVDRDWPVGSLTGLTYAVYGPNSVGSDGSTATDGEFLSAGAKFQDHGVQAGDILYINDAVDTGNNGYHMITGLKTGSEDTTLEVNTVEWAGGSLTGLDFEILPGSITYQGLTKGTWFQGNSLRARPNSLDSTKYNLEIKDGDFLLETTTSLDRSNSVASLASDSSYVSAVVRSNRGEPVIGKSFDVSGGDDGYTSVADSDFIGSTALKTGLKSFRNKELVEFDIVIAPGKHSQNIQDELTDLCESRGDCIAILDPPDSPTITTVQEINDFVNGTNIRTTALNSSYTAIYWSWQKVYDEYHDLDVWTAPSGHVAGVFTNNDNLQNPWYAPAGFKRGLVRGSTDVRFDLDQDDRDSLQGPDGKVNPIVNFVGSGIHVYGQKTTQTADTALNRVNVRRMLTYAKRAIEKASRNLIFDPNDEVLWREFKQLVTPTLDFILSNRGIQEFLVIADETTTTAAVQEQNKMIGKLFIKPTKAAEIIEIQFVLTSQGANFSELAA